MGREVPRRIRDRCVQLLSTGHTVQDVLAIMPMEFPHDDPPSATFLHELAAKLDLGRSRGRPEGRGDSVKRAKRSDVKQELRDEVVRLYAIHKSVRKVGAALTPPISGARVSKILQSVSDGTTEK